MKLFNVAFLLHTSFEQCYVVAEDCTKAEEMVLSTYKEKYNSTFLTIKEIEYIADTDYHSPLAHLILERTNNEKHT